MPSKPHGILAKLTDALHLNGEARVFYHLGRPNFGDDINPWFLGTLTGRSFRWGSTRRRHLLGVGSIAELASRHSLVMGSGLLEPLVRSERPLLGRVAALRGALSAEMLGVTPSHLGDPICLVDRLLPRPPVRAGSVGIVPHVINVPAWREQLRGREDLTLIDPAGDPLSVLQAIAGCERLASQSLHGLAVADAYGIPAVWIEPSPGMVGGRFKFDDYHTAFAEPRQPVALAAFVRGHAELPWMVGCFRGDKAAYLSHLRYEANEFLSSAEN